MMRSPLARIDWFAVVLLALLVVAIAWAGVSYWLLGWAGLVIFATAFFPALAVSFIVTWAAMR